METQETESQSNTKQQKQSWIVMPDFKRYYTAVVIKTDWQWHKNRHADQWYRIENQERNPNIYRQLKFDKQTEINPWRKEGFFNKCCLENWSYM